MIIRHSKFVSDSFGDGGSKRSAQIEELLNQHSIHFKNEEFVLPKGQSIITLFWLSIRAILFISKSVGWHSYPTVNAKIDAIKYFALRIPIILDKYLGKDCCFIWESTTSSNYGYPFLMKAAGASIIGIPHNLESVVPTQIDSQTKAVAPHWFEKEIERLKLCDTVFAISKEETWLLRLFGINAHYLPYYPPEESFIALLKIRTLRSSRPRKEKKDFLLLGSATNPPTRSGMQALIEYANDIKMSYSICVAGFGTDSLCVGKSDCITLLGPISVDQLNELLTTVDALLVYQPPTSGSLTRITEMLIAGIPVFANFNAARNFHNTEDVVQYDSFDDLFEKLESFQPHQSVLPAKNEVLESAFISSVKQLSK